MMRAQIKGLLAALLLAPLGGYWLAAVNTGAEADAQRGAWQWPEWKQADATPPAVALERFWPLDKQPEAEPEHTAAEDATKAEQDWSLVAVINQGRERAALVLSQQEIITLIPGMNMGEARQVVRIGPDYLQWRNTEGEQGELRLYPDAAPSQAEH